MAIMRCRGSRIDGWRICRPILCSLLAAPWMAAASAGAAAPPPPNIVFILADDLGYGDLGCYGQKKFRTPRIDRLAAEGMRFTQCYAGSTVCAPSRCTLMTGLHTGHAYIRGNAERPLRPDDLTVAELLKRAGYATGLFGKWGLGLEDTPGTPARKGFDSSFGYLDQAHAHRYNTDHLFRDGERVKVDADVYSEDLIAAAALDFIRANRDRPFFLYLPFTIPHAELRPPEDSLAAHRGEFPEPAPFQNPYVDLEPRRGGYRSQATPRAAFAAMVERLDRDVGRVLSLLAELGLDERTVVFFSSDNGPHREGGGDPEFFSSAGPLRGIKRDLYEGGIRVPMIARWPGRIPAGAVSDQVWAFWDFLPTAAEIAGIEPPPRLDGISMLGPLLGKGPIDHPLLYWEFHERGFSQAVRWGNWKAIRKKPWLPLELYSLDSDLGETRDRALENPKVVEEIEARLQGLRTESQFWKTPRWRRF
jgi:arylsulfatase A